MPKTGYIIYIADVNGGQKESSYGSPTISLSLQVNTWASFTSASITRSDGIRTVGELSEGLVSITSSLPIDASCKIRITFPTDMPITTSLF